MVEGVALGGKDSAGRDEFFGLVTLGSDAECEGVAGGGRKVVGCWRWNDGF